MSEYLDMLEKTFGKAIDKVKDYTDGKTAKEIYEDGKSKVAQYGKAAKLSFEVEGLKTQLKNAYAELGKIFYAQIKDKPSEDMKELVEKINTLTNDIYNLSAEVEKIKFGSEEENKDLEVEFGEVVDDYEKN